MFLFLSVEDLFAKHAWDHDHKIDFENGKLIDSGNYRTRKTLESWRTAIITNSDNISKPLLKEVGIKRGNGIAETEKRKPNCGNEGKRGKAEKRVKGGKRGKRRKKG